MSIYTDQLAQTLTTQSHRSQRIYYVSIALFIGIAVISGVFTYTRIHSSRVSLPAELESVTVANQRELPVTGVAGASKTENNNDGFAVINAETTAPPIGTAGTCSPGELFSIGEKETTPAEHPADELNWVGALDVIPDYSNPFIIGETSNTNFPWRTADSNPDTLQTEIIFNYIGQPAEATVHLSWSPGKQGEKQKELYLDNQTLGKTPLHQGSFDETSWEFMPIVHDSIDFSLTPGQHTLTIYSHSRTAGESVWDYIALDIVGCN